MLSYAQYLQVKQFKNKIGTKFVIFFNVQHSFFNLSVYKIINTLYFIKISFISYLFLITPDLIVIHLLFLRSKANG